MNSLGKCFSEDEFIPLLKKFFLYSAKVQNAIIELSDSRMNKVVESMDNIDFNILNGKWYSVVGNMPKQ